MKLDHIEQIKGNVSLSTNLKSSNILDGAYKSIFKGKSLNFEELREYNVGDNVKDIDWRASARSMNILVREHIAEKKHNILFILDSKFEMTANANKNELKKDILLSACGTIAYLAYKNGDYVGAIYMKQNEPNFFPLKQNLYSIENFLTYYDEDLKKVKIRGKIKNPINESIKYINNYMKKKAMVFIITDMQGLETMDEELVKFLTYRNDVMIIQVEDVSLFERKSYDISNRKYFSPMFTRNRRLRKINDRIKEEIYQDNLDKFKKYRVSLVRIENLEEVVPKIIELLKLHNEIIFK